MDKRNSNTTEEEEEEDDEEEEEEEEELEEEGSHSDSSRGYHKRDPVGADADSDSEVSSSDSDHRCPAAQLLNCRESPTRSIGSTNSINNSNSSHSINNSSSSHSINSMSHGSNTSERSPEHQHMGTKRQSAKLRNRLQHTSDDLLHQHLDYDHQDHHQRRHQDHHQDQHLDHHQDQHLDHHQDQHLDHHQDQHQMQRRKNKKNASNNNNNSSSSSKSYQRIHKTSLSGRMNTIFMEERLEEEEEEEEEEDEDDRPIRPNMRVREDTMDGAENPDTDPPQRRKTLEDISITELSALGGSLPPEYPDDESPPTLLPCLTCNRTFNPKALDRHRKVCQKISVSSKKKQVFNALKQRFEGLESPPGSGGRAGTPERKTTPPSKKASRWREKHQEFLRTIRAARGAPEGDADDGPPAPLVPSDYIKCPSCERHFGPKAAERHIEWCKEQSNRLRRNSADTQLTERLKSRTKYVPPKPGQSGWRAPKKTDVISSIPPPSTGPPTTSDRRISPPPVAPFRRGQSPGPVPQRQYSTASLGRAAARSFSSLLQAVTNTYSSPYGQRPSASSASGYATPSSYSAYGGTTGGGSQTPNLVRSGSFSGTSPGGSFSRSASLRGPSSSRRSAGGRIARRRDLASDMLASVCLGSSPARGEPEGNEADDFSSRETTLSPPPFSKSLIDSKFDSSFDAEFDSKYDSSKYDSKFDSKYDSKFDSKFDSKYDSKYDSPLESSYDPYSAAELQMQALLGPSQSSGLGSGGGLGAAGMGMGSLGSFLDGGGGGGSELGDSIDLQSVASPSPPKRRLSKINTLLTTPGRRSSRQLSPGLSDIQSSSPGVDYNSDKRNWRLSPSPPPQGQRGDRWSPSPHSPTHAWSPTRTSPSRWGNESPSWNREDRLSITSLSGGSRDGGRFSASSGNTTQRGDERGLSPSISSNPREDRFSLSSGTGSLREDRYSSGSLSRDGRFSVSSGSSRVDRFSTGSNPSSSLRDDRLSTSSGSTTIQRTLGNGSADSSFSSTGRKSSAEENKSASTLSSLRALRTALQGDGSASKKFYDSPTDGQNKPPRTSSGSSTDSSLPALSSSTSSNSPATTAKAIRGDAVGGHSDEVSSTPRLSSLSSIRSERNSIGRGSQQAASDRVTEDPLEKAISSLSNIGTSLLSAAREKQPSVKPVVDSSGGADTAGKSSSVPRFCHECGHKYPVSVAKFCCQCGCRRAPLEN